MSARRVAAQLRMELRLLLRNGENLLVTAGIPVGLLVFFSVVDVLPIDGQPVRFLFPGMLTVGVMSAGMVSLAIATGFERSYLVLKRLGATPLRRGELVAAKILAVLLIEVGQVVLLTGTALALGWRGALDAVGALGAAVVLMAGTSAFVGLGLTMAGRLRAVVTLAVSNALFIVLLLVSGVVFPLDRLPVPLSRAAALTPSAALATSLRTLLDHGRLDGVALAVLAVWAVAAPAAAAVLFRWEETSAVRRAVR